MKTSEAIKKRYSCRSYSEKKVNKKTILELLRLANWAPSASNKQNRQFVVISDRNDREWLAEMNHQEHIGEAPVVVLVTYQRGIYFKNKEDYEKGLGDWQMRPSGEVNDLEGMWEKWGIQDAAAAVENLMLAATERGLATCWLGIMDFEGVKRKFGVPRDFEPVCLVTLGYVKPAHSQAAARQRKPIDKLVHWGKW